MKYAIPSPAVAIVGRHNSGKTTLVEKLISSLAGKGYNVGSIKHHSHKDFEIDYPGKDSYRHRAAGATETVIASPIKLARVKTLEHEVECSDIVDSMPGHDIIVVEGYRKSGLPTIEIMRSGNNADSEVAKAFSEAALAGDPLQEDFIQTARKRIIESKGLTSIPHTDYIPSKSELDAEQYSEELKKHDLREKIPTSTTVAIVTDIPCAMEAADIYGIPYFGFDEVGELVGFLEEHYVRPRISVVIQAGGESRRMGRSKATVPFRGRPLICNLIERLAPAADELIITTNEMDALSFVKEQYDDLDIKLVSDSYEFRGALPGLYTALNAASNPYVAVVACDMVFASATLVAAEAIEMADKQCDIVVPVNKHGFEPFHAMYRKDICLKAVQKALDDGKSKVQAIFDYPGMKVIEFTQDRVLRVEPFGGCFINANTPEELAHIEENYVDML